ncbi:MAG: sortase, partial [Anaerolineae bacterium]
AINLDSEVVEVGWSQREINGQLVSVWDVAEYAAGWHRNSALPGHSGNIVLSGHHNILGEVFRYTVDLEVGDLITLYVDDFPYQYRVEEKFIVKDKGEPEEVRQANARWIGEFTDPRLTMITCWPYNNNTHRVIVVAKPYLEETESGADN